MQTRRLLCSHIVFHFQWVIHIMCDIHIFSYDLIHNKTIDGREITEAGIGNVPFHWSGNIFPRIVWHTEFGHEICSLQKCEKTCRIPSVVPHLGKRHIVETFKFRPKFFHRILMQKYIETKLRGRFAEVWSVDRPLIVVYILKFQFFVNSCYDPINYYTIQRASIQLL